MNNWELLMAGIKLLIFGMGMVYVFLVLMIYVMKALQKVLGPGSGPTEAEAGQSAVARKPDNKLALVAAAAAAVHLKKNGAKPTTEAVVSAPVENIVQKSPLPGTVVKVLVQPGAEVAEGESVVILEALKMETEIRAEHKGIISSIKVATGQVVVMGEPLFSMEAK